MMVTMEEARMRATEEEPTRSVEATMVDAQEDEATMAAAVELRNVPSLATTSTAMIGGDAS